MKCTVLIDREREEEILIYAHEKTAWIEEIEQFVHGAAMELIGYTQGHTVRITPSDVHCFIVEKNRIYALTDTEKLQLRCRLYQLEEQLGENFIKISQSCIANIKKIRRFNTSISGTLLVDFQNGYTDYVSRRHIKSVKERLGIQ